MDSAGSVRNSSRVAVSPPRPESKTPIGRESWVAGMFASGQLGNFDRPIERQVTSQGRERLPSTSDEHSFHLRKIGAHGAHQGCDREILRARPAAKSLLE